MDEYLFNADGEYLVVAQQGRLRFLTEFGRIEIEPGEVCVVMRGMIFRVELVDHEPARAYVCENYGGSFTLPDRGPIGANCLANPRDFLTPVAAYEDRETPSILYAILFDHPDPSIFTVLTAPSETPGTANIDFVIFPERWGAAEDTFRPPWYHRNIMSEFMGLVYGVYDAKPEGFSPGDVSLHNCRLPHGPDAGAFEHATTVELKPVKLTGTMAFMFETRFPQHVTAYAGSAAELQKSYHECWAGLAPHFNPSRRDA